MRIVRDARLDSGTATSVLTIPVYADTPGNMQRGSIIFNESLNSFCGKVNNSVVTPLGSRVAFTMTTGVNPAGSAVTLDSKKAYIANNANYGDYTLTVPPMNINTVTVLDLETMLPVKTIQDASFNEPYTVTINPAGTFAYVTNSAGSTITIINTTTDLVIGTITGFDGPSGMVFTPDGTRAYVNNYGATPGVGSGNGNTINVVNMTVFPPVITGTITLATLPDPPAAPAALTISPDGLYVYTANYVDGNPNTSYLSRISTLTNTVVGNIGPFAQGFSGPFAIKITPDGTKAVVTNFGSNNFVPFGSTVSIVNLVISNIITNIQGGIQPSGLDITPDGKYAYFSNYNTLYAYVYTDPNPPNDLIFDNQTAGAGTVNIIDLNTLTLTGQTIAVGQSPGNITITPDGKFALVSNYTSNTVSVISL